MPSPGGQAATAQEASVGAPGHPGRGGQAAWAGAAARPRTASSARSPGPCPPAGPRAVLGAEGAHPPLPQRSLFPGHTGRHCSGGRAGQQSAFCGRHLGTPLAARGGWGGMWRQGRAASACAHRAVRGRPLRMGTRVGQTEAGPEGCGTPGGGVLPWGSGETQAPRASGSRAGRRGPAPAGSQGGAVAGGTAAAAQATL